LEMREHMQTVRKSGLRALWMGVEDMTATLVKKGQSVNKTIEAFRMLKDAGISPMPMMMHYDAQPLLTRGKPDGLLNQVKILRKAGAIGLQVLMITPATGSKMYEDTFKSGMVYESVGRRKVEPYMLDGNYVVASNHKHPWTKQFNIMAAYLYFYNPLRMLYAICRPKNSLYLVDCGMQVIGMWGLSLTIRRTLGWAFRLMFCKIRRRTAPPSENLPMRSPDGGTASHALL
ncbi:MAG TPA: radical SAM protein, partial [Phycisphaerae bacterium]|nr:radical SAM protein [Phycisphaerae bacterium]